MVTILFVCLGNICRSPMAEALMTQLVKEEGLENQITIDSAGTSDWNEGNPVHEGTRSRLAKENISVDGLFSRPLKPSDGEFDYIIGMDGSNMTGIYRFFQDNDYEVNNNAIISQLLEFSGRSDDIADPWYTGDFDATYDDVLEGCQALLQYIKDNDLR